MQIFSHVLFLAIGLFGRLALAAAGASTVAACKELSKTLPGRVSLPLSIDYYRESTEYWSTVLRDIKPACVVVPESASELATGLKILNKYPDVKFTAKSGGHDPNPGHATVRDGVLFSLSEISGTIFEKSSSLAYVKPGGEWNDVITTLNQYGVTVVGGRLGKNGAARALPSSNIDNF